MRKSLLTIFVLSAASFAVTATQTDWSGGSGVSGPVTDWGNSYDVGDQIDDNGSPILTPLKHTVDGSFGYALSVYAADVDDDGDIDVLGASEYQDDITWWENTDGTGTVWTEHTVDGDFTFPTSVYATDVDGDGDTDVLGASHMAFDITWWENTDGTGTVWTEHTVDGDVIYPTSVYATDVDGDGNIDVLGAGANPNAITWWENTDGTGTVWTEHTVDDSFDGAQRVFAIDVNGDGDIDVLGAAYQADDITWWENSDGTGTSWTEHTVDGDFNGASSIYATDVDGDGDVDVLGAAVFADDITWWENSDGTGTSWTEHTVDGDFYGATSVYATDVDGDGNIDVLGAAQYNHEIAWWDVMGFSPAGTLESSILAAGAVDYWENFTSTGDEPAGTILGFQFRSSDDSANMGAWSDTVFAASVDLSTILSDSTDFLQYRAILQTTDPSFTPVLNEVAVTYTTIVGVADDNTGEVLFWGLAPYTNPSFGNFTVQVSTPQSGVVDLVLHDITGRVVSSYSQELPGGIHSVSFNNLAEGVYFCTMHAGDFTATERVVVLE